MRSWRDKAAYSPVFKGFATLVGCEESLQPSRARYRLFTRLALVIPDSTPKSLPSLCLTASGLSGGWLRSFGPNPPGLASE